MHIGVISDTRLPTSAEYPGHGLGKSMLELAEGLAEFGHRVTLYAGPGSAAGVEVVIAEQERELAHLASGCDVVIDGSHEHLYQTLYPGYPVINRSGDREAAPGRNAVYVSRAQAQHFGAPQGRVIYTGIREPQPFPQVKREDWLLWMGPAGISHKRVDIALQVAGLSGWGLVIAGPGSERYENGVGPVAGQAKWELLARARAVLVTGEIEAGPRTALEAALVGTPVLGLDRGGTPEYIGDGESGWICRDAQDMTAFLPDALPPAGRCKQWVNEHRGYWRMIREYAALCTEVASGRAALADSRVG